MVNEVIGASDKVTIEIIRGTPIEDELIESDIEEVLNVICDEFKKDE